MSRRIRPEGLIVAVALAIAACWLPIRMRFPFDDTYITFRYAANLAHGFGIVWNPGGAHTEGYTNFLMVLLLTPFSAMGWDLVAVSQAIGVIAVVVSAIAIYRVARIVGDAASLCDSRAGSQTKVCATLAVALFLFDPFTWMNAYSGLETSLFTMWLLLAIWAVGRGRPIYAFALATLATLTRPEGALMGMILLLVGMVSERRITNVDLRIKGSKKIILYWMFAFVLPLLIYAGWKWWYFGNLLPNSFYVKVSQVHPSGLRGLFPGRGAMRIFYEGVWYLLPIAMVAVWKGRKSAQVQIALLWCALLTAFYCFSQLIQNDYQRFTFPIEAMLIVLTGIGVARLKIGNRVMYAAAAVVLLSLQIGWPLYERGGLGFIERTNEATSSYPAMARVFRSIPDHAAITLAWGDAGRLPYYSGMRSIDPVGLNTNEIAHARTGAEVVRYVIRQKPDLLVIPLVYPRDIPPAWNRSPDSGRMILLHGQGLIGSVYPELARAALRSTYKPLFMSPQPVYDIEFLVDTASPHYRDIVNTIAPLIGHDSDFLPPNETIR